jgi:hypothetical protein
MKGMLECFAPILLNEDISIKHGIQKIYQYCNITMPLDKILCVFLRQIPSITNLTMAEENHIIETIERMTKKKVEQIDWQMLRSNLIGFGTKTTTHYFVHVSEIIYKQ